MLDNNIFKGIEVCVDDVEILFDVPHKLQLIELRCRQYLKIRFFSYAKYYTYGISKPISRRQNLTKRILFSNM